MPLVRLVLPFLLGILMYLVVQTYIQVWVFAALYLILVVVWLVLKRYWLSHFGRRWVFGLIASAVCFVAAYHLTQSKDHRYAKGHFSGYDDHTGALILRINEPVAEKTNSYQLLGKVSCFIPNESLCQDNLDSTEEAVIGQSDPIRVKGNIILYLEKDSLAGTLRYGDVVIIENLYEEVRPPQNPGQFNYKRFLANQHIFHSSYRRSGSWRRIDTDKGSPLVRWSLQFREQALKVFSDQGLPEREFAVISALLLGYRQYLDEDLQREFAGAGAMHILCVSGLHVGIIYLVLKTLLSFLRRLPGGLYIQTLLVLILIWLYASITGFSPSVLRASTMFSFVATGQSLHRRTNIYNTLAASAMLLLIIDPYILTRIGFQLSYLAVLSIVSIQPMLYKQVQVKHKVLDKAWGIITVSIAAQAATGPLSLFYFHQFPNYFLLTNLIVIPLSGMIIYSGLFSLLVHSVPWLGYVAAKLLHGLLFMLQASVKHIEGLPYSTSGNIYFGLPETVLMFMVLVFGCIYLVVRRLRYLVVALAALLMVTAFFSYRSIQLHRQRHFVVYHVNQATVIDFFQGTTRAVVAGKQLLTNPAMAGFQTTEYRISRGVPKPGLMLYSGLPAITTISRPLKHSRVNSGVGLARGLSWWPPYGYVRPPFALVDTENKQSGGHESGSSVAAGGIQSGHYIFFAEKLIMLVSSSHTPISHNDAASIKVPVDYLIICSNPKVDPKTYLRVFKPLKVIIDASNSNQTVSRWKEACESLHVTFWVVSERGAFKGKVEG